MCFKAGKMTTCLMLTSDNIDVLFCCQMDIQKFLWTQKIVCKHFTWWPINCFSFSTINSVSSNWCKHYMLRYQAQRTSIEVPRRQKIPCQQIQTESVFLLNHEFMQLFFFRKHTPSTPTQIRGFYRLRDRILAPREAFTGWTGWYRGLPSHWIWVGVLLSFGL